MCAGIDEAGIYGFSVNLFLSLSLGMLNEFIVYDGATGGGLNFCGKNERTEIILVKFNFIFGQSACETFFLLLSSFNYPFA